MSGSERKRSGQPRRTEDSDDKQKPEGRPTANAGVSQYSHDPCTASPQPFVSKPDFISTSSF